ncbi:MAG: hypothetical protein LC708_03885, partial [Actinobacteria bacterium]|nr:hypothetical protein [Actinomycetota bacterium]
MLLVLLTIALGCDREPATPAPVDPLPVRPTLEIRPVAPLLPARRTHIAVDARGNVFWSQEAEGGDDDVVFSLGDDGVPRATPLTADAALAATNEAGGAETSGNIQSLAFGPDGALYFYVTGGTDRRTIAAFGRFLPSTSVIQLLAPTKSLMTATGMGRALALARGTVVVSDERIVLWLRHTDTSSLIELDPRAATSATGARAELKQTPPVRTDAGPLRMTRENQFLAPGRDGSLLLLDHSAGALFTIDSAGNAVVLQELPGLPQALSLPAVDSRGRVLLLVGAGATIPPRTEEQ